MGLTIMTGKQLEINNPISKQIWKDRYCKNEETLQGNLDRVARYCSTSTEEYNEFFDIMNKGLFFPAGRTMSNSAIGSELTLNNCFVASFVEDSIEDIFDKVKLGALTHKRGGGIGYEFSKIRPNGSNTSNDAIASGVISFMEVFNTQTSTILQGGRRGANMGILSIYHPDIYSYLNAKSYDEGKLIHFNLSIMVDDEFMKAKDNNETITLHYPIYDEKGHMIKDESKWTHKQDVNALELWDLIMKKAYDTGEYGIFFYDNINSDNNTYYMETIVCSNPCGEYLSGVLFGDNVDTDDYYGACNLGSLFLHKFVIKPFTKNANINYFRLSEAIRTAVKFLDNIIDINKFPHDNYKNYQLAMRTIGLGITGLANVFAMMGIKYGSDESVELTDKLMSFITKESYSASIALAVEKGSFPFLDREKFVKSGFITKHAEHDSDWDVIIEDILKFGIRNARILSVAPTGTLSLSYGENCSSGLEPVFSNSYKRKIKIGGQDDSDIQIFDMMDYGYAQWKQTKVDNIVSEDVFVTAMDLSVQDHINILEVVAYHTDMSCSKTINIPTDYTFEATKQVYDICHKAKIKGCTIFRPNAIRQGILISNDSNQEQPPEQLKRGEWKSKAKDTIYHERKIYIGCGKLKLFIGWSDSEKQIQDFYVLRVGNGGCEKNIQTTAIAMSGMLRLGGNILNIEKAFSGMGGCNSFVSQRMKGDKLSKGSSCGTAILNEIKLFLKDIGEEVILPSKKIIMTQSIPTDKALSEEEKFYLSQHGEIAFAKKYNKCPMPSCGEQLENTSGCLTCSSCGFSKCS